MSLDDHVEDTHRRLMEYDEHQRIARAKVMWDLVKSDLSIATLSALVVSFPELQEEALELIEKLKTTQHLAVRTSR